WLAEAALQFGPPEYFALSVTGLAVLSRLSGGSVIVSFVIGGLGLAIGTVGMEPISGFRRFTFGSMQLSQGLELVPIIMGLYGVGEVVRRGACWPRKGCVRARSRAYVCASCFPRARSGGARRGRSAGARWWAF